MAIENNSSIQDKKTVEDKILKYVNLVLTGRQFENTQSVKNHIIHPYWMGVQSISRASYDEVGKDHFVGFSYDPVNNRIIKGHISGIIIDDLGIGFIDGKLMGNDKLTFERYALTANGLSKEVDAIYAGKIVPEHNLCAGMIMGKRGSGDFQTMHYGPQMIPSKFDERLLHEAFANYYESFLSSQQKL